MSVMSSVGKKLLEAILGVHCSLLLLLRLRGSFV
jgi:hypothetical protein